MNRLASLAVALGLVAGVSGCVAVPMRYDAQIGGYVPSRSVSYGLTPYYYYGGFPTITRAGGTRTFRGGGVVIRTRCLGVGITITGIRFIRIVRMAVRAVAGGV